MLGATPREFESRILRCGGGGRELADTAGARPRPPRLALTALVTSPALVALAALLGPSVAVPRLPGDGPPLALAARPGATLITALLAAAVAAGAAGLAGAGRAVRGGWCPRPGRLRAAGALAAGALTLLSPVGSADPLSYAAYGRMAALGLDPYATRPADLAVRGDPFGAAVEPPWQRAPSVYGPLATAEQTLAAGLADDPRTAVWLLGLVNAAAFVGTGLLLHRLLAPDRSAQVRAALLWSANPLLLHQLVAGAHVDTLAAALAVAALAATRRRQPTADPLTGGLAAAATAVKLPAALVGGALALALLRSPRRLAALAAGALAVLLPAYLHAGPHAFDQLRRASRFVAHATPWRPAAVALDTAYGPSTSRRLVALLALLLALLLAVLFTRGLPKAVVPAARPALALTLGWLLAAAYALPWYDATAWALLALLASSAFDAVLLTHTGVLALAYLPGRDVPLPLGLHAFVTVLREQVAPLGLTAVIVAAVTLALRARPLAADPPLREGSGGGGI